MLRHHGITSLRWLIVPELRWLHLVHPKHLEDLRVHVPDHCERVQPDRKRFDYNYGGGGIELKCLNLLLLLALDWQAKRPGFSLIGVH